MKNFIIYYLVSGIITSAIVYFEKKKFKKLVEDKVPFFVKDDLLILLNFLSGFIQLPIIIVQRIYTVYLLIKLRRVKKIADEKKRQMKEQGFVWNEVKMEWEQIRKE